MKTLCIFIILAFISASLSAQTTKTVTVYDSPDHSEWHTEEVQYGNTTSCVPLVDSTYTGPSYHEDSRIYTSAQMDSVMELHMKRLEELKGLFHNDEERRE